MWEFLHHSDFKTYVRRFNRMYVHDIKEGRLSLYACLHSDNYYRFYVDVIRLELGYQLLTRVQVEGDLSQQFFGREVLTYAPVNTEYGTPTLSYVNLFHYMRCQLYYSHCFSYNMRCVRSMWYSFYYILCVDISVIKPLLKMIPVK